MKGPDVAQLMLLLVRLKYLAPEEVNADQMFSQKVEDAVKKFQTERKLTADGVVGPMVFLYLQAASEGG